MIAIASDLGRPLSALQIRVFLLCALVVLLDGYDLQAMGSGGAQPRQAMASGKSAFTIAQTASVLGLGLGSAFIAPLGDRLGRRPLLLGGLAIILVTSLGAATATSTWQLAGWRLAGGPGPGRRSEQCLGTHRRVRAAGAARHHHDVDGCMRGTRRHAGGLTAPAGDCRGGLARSCSWWARRCRCWHCSPRRRAAGIARRILATQIRHAASGGTLLALLRPPYRERTLRLWLVYGLSAMLLYFLISWLPVVSHRRRVGQPPRPRVASRCCNSVASPDPWSRPGWWTVAVPSRPWSAAYSMTLITALLFAVPATGRPGRCCWCSWAAASRAW